MKEKCLVDTSVLLKIIMENDYDKLKQLYDKYDLFVSPNIIEEVVFKIISFIIGEKLGTYKFYEIKKLFEKGQYKEEIIEKISLVEYLIKLNILKVLEINADISLLAIEISMKYNLLPNDALTVAVCKYYGIEKIASYDEDFDRVLKRIEP